MPYKAAPARSSQPRARLYYDADCGFCRWALAWILRWDRAGRLEPVAISSAEGDRELGDLGEARLESWHLVRGGQRFSGGLALAPLLEELPGGSLLAPIARRLERALVPAYGWVAGHRGGLSRLVPRRAKERADALVASRARSGARAESAGVTTDKRT
jgi:predicted DCC family thiol-disulfide oxidoreductase YuxK